MKKVGVLSLQGDFAAHGRSLERAGAEPVFVRDAGQLRSIDGLIIPGGESTTMLKLMRFEGWLDKLAEFGREKPIFGSEVSNPPQESLALMDIGVERNAYGRQVDSRVASLDPAPEFARRTAPGKLEAVFIRAPIIRRAADGVTVLARYAGDPVLVEQGRHLAATFHPELTGDCRVHQLFLEKL
jgi:5'-phosphate synthase pdxT subunit